MRLQEYLDQQKASAPTEGVLVLLRSRFLQKLSVWEVARTRRNDLHPTMKPVALCERAIKNSSKHGQVVLDLFGGSGSTLVAAEKSGRVACLVELDHHYCDVIIRRWQEFTGNEAALQGDGIRFDELAMQSEKAA